MNKTFFLILSIFSIFVVACSDSQEAPVDPQKYNVKFSVNNFSTGIVDFNENELGFKKVGSNTISAVGDTLKNHADYLYFLVFNESGTLVNLISQTSSQENFGTIQERLPTGKYHVAFVASRGSLTFENLQKGYNGGVGFHPSTYPTNAPWTDTFTFTKEITVGFSDIVETVTLKRLGGAIELKVTDAIPSGVTKVSIVRDDAISGSLDGATYSYTRYTNDFEVTSADAGKTNKTFWIYSADTSHSFEVTIRAYMGSTLISEKIVKDVRAYRNKKTVLSGNLFNGIYSGLGFTLRVDPTWEEEFETVTF